MQFVQNGFSSSLTPEEIQERRRLIELEQKDRERYVADITTLMKEFQCYGISADTSAQLAAMFYNDPIIKKRRANRVKK